MSDPERGSEGQQGFTNDYADMGKDRVDDVDKAEHMARAVEKELDDAKFSEPGSSAQSIRREGAQDAGLQAGMDYDKAAHLQELRDEGRIDDVDKARVMARVVEGQLHHANYLDRTLGPEQRLGIEKRKGAQDAGLEVGELYDQMKAREKLKAEQADDQEAA